MRLSPKGGSAGPSADSRQPAVAPLALSWGWLLAAAACGAQTTTTASRDEVVTLSVFEVSADPSDTYDATNTNSVTGTNTPLNKTPLDAKVFNRQLMDELGIVDTTEMLSKLAGLGNPIVGSGEDARGDVEGDRQTTTGMTMRGLAISNPRRDGFLRSNSTWRDTYDMERMEAVGGSNSLLFGSGDAGGVITSTTKRAYLNRRPTATFTGMMDSEGSRRATLDTQAGGSMFAVRFNGVRSDTRYFRPATRVQVAGAHVAMTVQPWTRLQIRGEIRHFTHDRVFPQGVTVRAPLSWQLPTQDPLGNPIRNGPGATTATNVDNKSSRYLVAFPDVAEFTRGGPFDLTSVDAALGPFHRDRFLNIIRSITAESTLADGLALQLRYGHDSSNNDPLRATTTTVYAPGATGNNHVDSVTGQVGTKWAMSQSMNATPYYTGARGYRAALAYQRNFGRWGRHQANVFRQDMDSWVNQQPWRFYEADESGRVVQNLANIKNADSGRIAMPAMWMPAFPSGVIGGEDWFFRTVKHPNGRTYLYLPQIYAGAVPKTPENPMGLSGPTNASTGQSTVTSFFLDDTRETSHGASVFSEWLRGRVDTMIGYRNEEASTFRINTGVIRGPITYDSLTTGVVVDTPIPGLRLSANYATNAKINFDTTRDVYNQPLPPGKGTSRDFGLKVDLWNRRVSGNLNYYISEAQNFTASLGGQQNDIDPNGINGRNGGAAYTYSKTSDGFNLTITMRPLHGWEIRANVATANGRERSDITLSQFYNDQFNTTTVGGQTVIGVRPEGAAGITPLLVPSDPADPNSPGMPLSLSMMKDPTSAYYAVLDAESGQILNANSLGLDTPGVGTNVTGLPVSEHQLGFVSPSGGTIIVRRAGEKTVGYAERSYSLINRYQFNEGWLRGVVLGLSTTLREDHRAYMYNDASDGGRRKTYYFPDRFLNDAFAVYRFTPARGVRASVQLNVSNLLDANRILYLVNSSTGALRYAQWFNSPRKFSFTTSLTF